MLRADANNCYAACENASNYAECQAACGSFAPFPSLTEDCDPPNDILIKESCDIEPSTAGASCTPGGAECTGGQVCGRFATCAVMVGGAAQTCTTDADCGAGVQCHLGYGFCVDPTVHDACDGDPTCSRPCASEYRCGAPSDNCDDAPFDTLPVCSETEICVETEVGEAIDPLDPTNGSNLDTTPFDPTDRFEQPSDPVNQKYPVADPGSCGGAGEPPCPTDMSHPWCRVDVRGQDDLIQDQSVSDNGQAPADNKRGHSGGGGPLQFDFDPNLELVYDVDPLAFGDSSFTARAAASVLAQVRLNNFIGFSKTVNVLDALAMVEAQRCGVELDARVKLFGIDFLPILLGERASLLDDYDTPEPVRTTCEEGILAYQTKVARAAKAMRDAQELLRQYKAVVDGGDTFAPEFCTEVLSGVLPVGFPAVDCGTATAAEVVDAFVQYYEQEVTSLRNAAFPTESIPRFDGNQSKSVNFPIASPSGKSQQLANVTFFVGPVPANLTVDAVFNYGITGGLSFELTPERFVDSLRDENAHKLASAKADVTPGAGASIDMFVGAGFDCGFAAAKLGIAGIITLANIDVPLVAGAHLKVRSEPEDARELPDDLTALLGTTPADTLFPLGGAKRFQFLAGYDYSATVNLYDILRGQIDARLKLKFFWFSKTYKAKIASFPGLPPQQYVLVSGGSRPDQDVNLGTVSMPLPFVELPRAATLDPPEDPSGSAGAAGSAGSAGGPSEPPETVHFDPNLVGRLFYDTQCVPPPPAPECPQIFDYNAAYVPNAEVSDRLVAYGTTGVDLHDRAKLFTASPIDPGGYGDVALRTGLLRLRNDVFIYDGWGGTSLDRWHRVSVHSLIPNSAGANVPTIVLSRSFSGSPDEPYHAIQNGEEFHLSPGAYYGTIDLNDGTLYLDGPGLYSFHTLVVNAGGTVVVNHGEGEEAGAVEVAIRDYFVWNGHLVNGTGRPNAHLFGYYGTGTVYLVSESGFQGTVVAPHAKLELNSRAYRGAYYANFLEVHQDATLTFDPCRGF